MYVLPFTSLLIQFIYIYLFLHNSLNCFHRPRSFRAKLTLFAYIYTVLKLKLKTPKLLQGIQNTMNILDCNDPYPMIFSSSVYSLKSALISLGCLLFPLVPFCLFFAGGKPKQNENTAPKYLEQSHIPQSSTTG